MGTLDQAAELKQRTKRFAIRIVSLFRSLPHSPDAQTLGKQLLRSGTSVAANYRSVCRARSKAEFISRMGVVIEEADESVFWLELFGETGVVCARTRGPAEGSKRVGGDFWGLPPNLQAEPGRFRT